MHDFDLAKSKISITESKVLQMIKLELYNQQVWNEANIQSCMAVSLCVLYACAPGRRPIRQCKACCLVLSVCCGLRCGWGLVGRLPPGHTASWMTCRYATQ